MLLNLFTETKGENKQLYCKQCKLLTAYIKFDSMPIMLQSRGNKPKMAYSRDLLKMAVMVDHGLSWIIMDYHGLSWTIMDYHGLTWTCMDWHGLAWTGMDWHGLAWTGMNWIGLDWTRDRSL